MKTKKGCNVFFIDKNHICVYLEDQNSAFTLMQHI